MYQVGFWSAVIVAGAAITFDVAVVSSRHLTPPWDVVGALVPSLVLAPAFLALIVSVHSSLPEEMRVWTRLAAAFAAVYVPLTTSAYVVELAVVEPLVMRGDADRVALLTLTRMDSVFNAVDGLGYAFMSLAAFFAAPAFEGARLERWIRRLFFATGILIVPILLTYFVDRAYIYVAGLWGITVPGAAILLAIYFRRRWNGAQLTNP
jgi:hypothetical protein